MAAKRTNKKDQPTRPPETKKNRTLGERAADRVAHIFGSWWFIISILTFLAIWIALNVIELIWSPWDPYPFILLNFFLSCMAAIQAPIILMSQNRSAKRDNIRSEYDYLINRKAEREIQDLQKDMETLKRGITSIKRLIRDLDK
jgi:uncharacterized membrane protein